MTSAMAATPEAILGISKMNMIYDRKKKKRF